MKKKLSSLSMLILCIILFSGEEIGVSKIRSYNLFVNEDCQILYGEYGKEVVISKRDIYNQTQLANYNCRKKNEKMKIIFHGPKEIKNTIKFILATFQTVDRNEIHAITPLNYSSSEYRNPDDEEYILSIIEDDRIIFGKNNNEFEMNFEQASKYIKEIKSNSWIHISGESDLNEIIEISERISQAVNKFNIEFVYKKDKSNMISYKDDELYDFFAVDVKPNLTEESKKILISYTKENYPPLAKRRKATGKVIINFICSKEGIPTNLSVSYAKPDDQGFGQCARKAVQLLKYTPGLKNNNPVPVKMSQVVNFKI